jgi:hypothetical protein
METTAVEWFRKQLLKRDFDKTIAELYEQAKAMEKEQIIDAATWGFLADTGEQYYKERYGTKHL